MNVKTMPLTAKMEFEKKPKAPGEPWTVRRLFPFASTVSAISKMLNAFEIFSAFMILITGFGELFGRNLSWFWYLILLLVLGGAFSSRFFEGEKEKPNTKQ